MPQISIIVPVYKAEGFLHRCVDSILSQSYSDFELLLVNDGSPDRSGELCEAYAAKDPRIRVFHKENGGQGTARNLALDWVMTNSDSRWISFVDSDDWVHRDYLRVLLEAAQDYSVKITSCNYYMTATVQEDPVVHQPEFLVVDADCAISQHYRHCTAPWGNLYARELFETLRFAEVRAFEDAYITHIPILKAGSMAITEEKLYYYYENLDSTTRKKWSTRNLAQIDAHETRVRDCMEHGCVGAYARELEELVITRFSQVVALREAVKEDPGCREHLDRLQPTLLPALRLARAHGVVPFSRQFLWIYEIAYPVKPIWVLRNLLEKYLGFPYPR